MRIIQISNGLIHLGQLQRAGETGHERVVLWLGIPGDVVRVREVFVPRQTAASDYFHIPREGMAQLMHHRREADLMVAAHLFLCHGPIMIRRPDCARSNSRLESERNLHNLDL